ncbi:CoA ester lyase [Reyranella sp. CPCC 100927]|uniref:HpcH/HpaI aldolase/citrate lyase family protein n=1 Tax=Reyranella sp. CPCC 100927 TaxID=2599616 RepID=UPI0011B6B2F9|nr:CoA ester lyase [Reyranella sp. CPCC 100927]TWT15631.1 CoA ester lyase [Reyranella sp. CPCC 100927]
MTATVRPRRSVLYMPGANTRALEKARTLPADALIFDLEDAVAPDAKAAARANVVAAAASRAYGKREIVIRANGLGTPWGRDDIVAIAGSGADAVLVPKLEGAADVAAVVELLDEAGAPPSMAMWGMMETPRGILHAEEIASASSRLACFVMGTNDLVKDLRARHTPMRLPMMVALGVTMLAARASGLAILDGVYNDIQDAEGFRASCVQGLEMGFDGKTLIHPSQVEPCNEVFAPTAADLAMAEKIVTAFDQARAAGKGVVTVDGRMIENLHVEQAQRQLALAKAIAALAGA